MQRALFFVVFLALVCKSVWADEVRYVLTSAADAVNYSQWATSGTSANGATAWSVRKKTLVGGRQDGVEVITVDNGRLQLVVVPTRGMSVYEVTMDDLRLGWQSPVKELVHPKYIRLASRGGLGWLEGFNEWMVRCGLEYAGHPGTDVFVNNTGDTAEMELTLHGKIGNLPASEVQVVIDEGETTRIRIRGRVDERMFYGPQLELWTEISTEVGSKAFRIDDRVVNRGASPQEFEIIYHGNYGPPLLEEGARFVGPIARVMPMNAHAAQHVDTFATYEAPTVGFVEQVYCLFPLADDQGQTEVMLLNASGTRGVSMRYAVEELPYLTLWKNTVALENGYVTGLEPGTNFPFNRRVERQQGRLGTLTPGQTRRFGLAFELHTSADSVQAIRSRIEGIQADHETVIEHEAPEVD